MDGLVQGNGAHFVAGPVYVTYPRLMVFKLVMAAAKTWWWLKSEN